METLLLEVPAMYGDHHVVEVRRLLLELPGVSEVVASSSFHFVEVAFDPALLKPEAVQATLEQAGYLGELPIPVETGKPATEGNGKKPYFRHTQALEQVKQSVGFTQRIPYSGRPLWPCPGMGVIRTDEE